MTEWRRMTGGGENDGVETNDGVGRDGEWRSGSGSMRARWHADVVCAVFQRRTQRCDSVHVMRWKVPF